MKIKFRSERKAAATCILISSKKFLPATYFLAVPVYLLLADRSERESTTFGKAEDVNGKLSAFVHFHGKDIGIWIRLKRLLESFFA